MSLDLTRLGSIGSLSGKQRSDIVYIHQLCSLEDQPTKLADEEDVAIRFCGRQVEILCGKNSKERDDAETQRYRKPGYSNQYDGIGTVITIS